MRVMKKIVLVLISSALLYANTPFDAQTPKVFDLSMFNTHSIDARINEDGNKNKKVRCRLVCDKKIHKEQLLKSALGFYKNSKIYHFEVSSYR
jgi:hypothetical protein